MRSAFKRESQSTQCLTTAELSIISKAPPEGLLEVDVLGSQRNSTEQGIGRHGVCAEWRGVRGNRGTSEVQANLAGLTASALSPRPSRENADMMIVSPQQPTDLGSVERWTS